MLVAFYTSRGNYEIFKTELYTLNLAVPLFVLMIALPGASQLPPLLQLNTFSMMAIAVSAQWLFASLLAKKVWAYGGRDSDE